MGRRNVLCPSPRTSTRLRYGRWVLDALIVSQLTVFRQVKSYTSDN